MSLYKLDTLADRAEGQGSRVGAREGVRREGGRRSRRRREARGRPRPSRPRRSPLTCRTSTCRTGASLVNDDFDIPSEVDEFWTKLRTKVIPSLKKKPAVVDRSAAQRAAGGSQADRAAGARGAGQGRRRREAARSVTVLSAYKQGYSWLYDVVRPALAGQGGRSDHDQVRRDRAAGGLDAAGHVRADAAGCWSFTRSTRSWPTELKIDLKKIHFEKTPIGSPAYEVIATAQRRRRAVPAHVRAEVRRAAVLRSFSRLRARPRHHRLDQGRCGRHASSIDERIETDPGALLGSLPGEDAAGALRPRDGAQQRQAARRKMRRSSAS